MTVEKAVQQLIHAGGNASCPQKHTEYRISKWSGITTFSSFLKRKMLKKVEINYLNQNHESTKYMFNNPVGFGVWNCNTI